MDDIAYGMKYPATIDLKMGQVVSFSVLLE